MVKTVLALALTAAACGGAAGRPSWRPTRVWPDPPAPAEVRWLGEYPDAAAPPPSPSWWKRATDAVAGVDERPRANAPTLVRPFGVAAIPDGFVVADPDARRVTRVAWPAGRAAAVGCPGRAWNAPLAVAVEADGTIYVADGALVKVPPAGPCAIFGAGRLVRPSGVAVAAGKIYVVDPPRHTVDVFTGAGAHVLAIGARGDAGGPGLNFPTAVAVAPDGTLLVVDALNFRVSRFGSDGRWLGSTGEPGDGGGAFGRPKAVAVDAGGRIFVSDAQHDVVIILSPRGDFELAVGGSGAGPGDLTLPAGVAIGGRLLFVADSHNHRVGVYELRGER